jgi:hypothetical protein
MQQWQTGRMHHIALWATGLREMQARLARCGVPARERSQGNYYRVVVNDPDGVELEINFPIAEAG